MYLAQTIRVALEFADHSVYGVGGEQKCWVKKFETYLNYCCWQWQSVTGAGGEALADAVPMVLVAPGQSRALTASVVPMNHRLRYFHCWYCGGRYWWLSHKFAAPTTTKAHLSWKYYCSVDLSCSHRREWQNRLMIECTILHLRKIISTIFIFNETY